MLQGYWTNEFGPTGTANGGAYAGKSYWICTENWSGQNFPIDLDVYNKTGGFSNGYVPLFFVVGYQNKVYYDDNGSDIQQAVRDAINEMPPSTGVYVANSVPNKEYQLGGSEVIDISNEFDSIEGAYPITKTIVGNSDPSVLTATINGDQLTLEASPYYPGTVTLQIQGEDTNNATDIDEIVIYVYNPTDVIVEDFEDGNFTGTFTWALTNSGQGAGDWSVVTSSPHEGSYCAESDDLRDGKWDAIETTVNYEAPGKITFWKKVSSESGYDFLNFYIDGVWKDGWSGEIGWSESSYLVETAGDHTFKFEYAKDASETAGSDLGWVDYISFYNKSTAIPPTVETPANVSAAVISGTDVTLTWDSAAGATSYIVYSSADPYGAFVVDNTGTFNGEEWTAPISGTKNFYYVISTDAKVKTAPQNIQLEENKSVKPVTPIVRSRMKKVKK